MTARLMLEPDHLWRWIRRVEAEFAHQQLTRGERDALLALRHFWIEGRECFPAEATLAARARCSVRTVRRAKARAAELGLLTWERRRKLVQGRWRRASNAYMLLIPKVDPSCGQKVGRTESKIKRKGNQSPAARSVQQQLAALAVSADELVRVQALTAARWAARLQARGP